MEVIVIDGVKYRRAHSRFWKPIRNIILISCPKGRAANERWSKLQNVKHYTFYMPIVTQKTSISLLMNM